MATQTDPYGLVGTTILERYSVDYFVGVGRYSAVYRGTQLDTLASVALKFFKVRGDLRPAQRPIIVQRMNEATGVLTDIAEHCPRVCGVREVASLVTAGGRWLPFMVQSWLEGSSLETILQAEHARLDQPRSLGQAMELLAPISDALAYGHAHGVVHGSLATRSIVVRENVSDAKEDWCVVDLLDLGVAAIIEAAQDRDRAFHEAPISASCFAPAYGAPEQFSSSYGPVGPWTDVFALALILVELVTGTRPLGEGTDDQLEAASVDPDRRPTPRSEWVDLGEYVESVFERALAVRPHARYASVSSFWEALRAAHRMSLVRSASTSSCPAFNAAPVSIPEPAVSIPEAPATDPVLTDSIHDPEESARDSEEETYAEVYDSELDPEDTDTDLVMARSARPAGIEMPYLVDRPMDVTGSHLLDAPVANGSGRKRKKAYRVLMLCASTVLVAGGATAIFEGARTLSTPYTTSSALAAHPAAMALPAATATGVSPASHCRPGMVKIPNGSVSMNASSIDLAADCVDANGVDTAKSVAPATSTSASGKATTPPAPAPTPKTPPRSATRSPRHTVR